MVESSDSDVDLKIGLEEKPTLFVTLGCRSGGGNEPAAVRSSLGRTIRGPLSGTRADERGSVNFIGLGNKEFFFAKN